MAKNFIHYVELASDSPISYCGEFVLLCTDEWDRVTCSECLARWAFFEGLRQQEQAANEHYQDLLASDTSTLGKEQVHGAN